MPSTRIKPRFNETDALGHINNAAMSVWFEVARIDALDFLRDGVKSAGRWLVATVTIDYLQETFHGTDVIIQMTEVVAGNTSLKMTCDMHQGDRLVARGSAVLVHVDMKSKDKLPVPEKIRAGLAELRQP